MGIPAPLGEMILFENKYRALGPKALSLGKQTIVFDDMKLKAMAKKHDITLRDTVFKFDDVTTQAKQNSTAKYLLDFSFWEALGIDKVDTMDVSDYEGATIIHDLCMPVDEKWHKSYDFIFDGSVLDNIFDPVAALKNTARMLKPGGIIVHIEMASNLVFEYLKFSPDWFYDYYAVNLFADCKVYVCGFNDVDQLLHGPWDMHCFMPGFDGNGFQIPSLGYKHVALIVIAEKGEHSTSEVNPVQWFYRGAEQNNVLIEAKARFVASARPTFGISNPHFVDNGWDGFLHCGTLG